MNHHDNIVRIKAVHNALGELQDKVVFVGGATISLYPDRQIFEPRPTDDVDIIVEIVNYFGRIELEEKLRSIGFHADPESKVVSRYKINGIIVDIMPTEDDSIGFKNRWYSEGFRNAIKLTIEDQTTIKILSAPYFIATKLEAFKSRGNNDGRTSHDFEDIIYILENRSTVWEEMKNAPVTVKTYLIDEFKNLAVNKNIYEWVDSNVERGSPPATYHILKSWDDFTS